MFSRSGTIPACEFTDGRTHDDSIIPRLAVKFLLRIQYVPAKTTRGVINATHADVT